MPAIAPDQLNCAIYLYSSIDSAKSGANAGGSGFLVGLPASSPGWEHLYAVTNKHVIDGGCHVIRINTHDGKSDTIPTRPEDWTLADDDDLAVLPIDLGEQFHWDCIHQDSFVTKEQVAPSRDKFQFNFGPGDDVVFIGRLVTHDGKERNRPAVRFGNISMMPDESDPVQTQTEPQVAFLVDCRSLPGASGSAALAYLVAERPGGINLLSGGARGVLLGVDCGHLPRWADIYEKDGTTKTGERVEMNSGISVVIPAWRLLDLLNAKHLVKRRQCEDQELETKLKASAAVVPNVSAD